MTRKWHATVARRRADTETYLGSPSLVVLPGGDLLASHDYFGPGAPRDGDGRPFLTTVSRSTDGTDWEPLAHVAGAWWSSLFTHRGDVYLLGVERRHGDVVVRRSTDGGRTWTTPEDGETGRLFAAGEGDAAPNYHCAPVPVVEHGGRLYRAFEDNVDGDWPRGFRSLVVSCPADADLLDASNWRRSEALAFPTDAAPDEWGTQDDQGAGWLEGNVVGHPDGGLAVLLRVNSQPVADRGALLRVRDGGRRLEFASFVEIPGGMTKFCVRRDPATGLYWLLSNPNSNPAFPNQRDVLACHVSADLREWRRVRTLTRADDPDDPETVRNVGFQYPDFRFDGDDLVYLSRTAHGGAHNYHDANRVTFDRVRDARELAGTE